MATMNAEQSVPGAQRAYFTHLAEGRFLIQRCGACDRHVFYPRVLCVHCGSPRLDWVAPAGTGTVYSTSIVRRKAEDGGDYNVALVDLDEGVRMMSRIEGVALDRIAIGMRVRARIAAGDEGPVVVFDPARGDER